jgi:uncharacterized protein YjbI with pentapeptide repeats
MKTEILQILRMQQEGKITQDQAAELLAVLADQAREKTGTAEPSQVPPAGKGGAPGPREARERSFAASSTAAIHGLVDTAIGVGATIGRAASVFGGEVVEMVHRDEGGNSVTLSKVDAPAGENFSFSGNTINVSKVALLTLRHAEVCGNTVNASKVAHLNITAGRFSQSSISGSSVTGITINGPDAPDAAGIAAGIRGLTLNASKFSRVHLDGKSALEVSTIQAGAVKDWQFTNATLRDSKVNDASVSGLALTDSALRGLTIERSHVQQLHVRGATLQDVRLSGLKVHDVKITGGTWNDVKIRRENSGLGGRETLLNESAFENCDLTGCEFAGCTFRRTTFRNLKLAGITLRNIDFTALTLETEEDFRRVAGV